MARSKDVLKKYSAVSEYIKSFNEVEREMYEKLIKRARKQNDKKRDQGISAREKIPREF